MTDDTLEQPEEASEQTGVTREQVAVAVRGAIGDARLQDDTEEQRLEDLGMGTIRGITAVIMRALGTLQVELVDDIWPGDVYDADLGRRGADLERLIDFVFKLATEGLDRDPAELADAE